jgi:hypothetical protein
MAPEVGDTSRGLIGSDGMKNERLGKSVLTRLRGS